MVPTSSILDGDLIVPGTVLAVHLAANSVTADKLAAGAVTAGTIAANAVGAEAIAADAILGEHIHGETITGDKLVMGAITADKIGAGAITAEKIGAGSVTTEKIEANAVTAAKINVGTLLASEAVINSIRSNAIPRVAVLPENPVAGQTLVYTGGSSDEALQWTGSAWKRLANDIIGTNVTITDNTFRVATQEVEIAILGADGEEAITKIDEGGAYFPAAYAPNVAPRWPGPYTLTVNPAAAPDEDAGVYNSLQTVADALAGVMLGPDADHLHNIGRDALQQRRVSQHHRRACAHTDIGRGEAHGNRLYLPYRCPCGVRIGNTRIQTQITNVSSVGSNRNCLLILENCIINRGAYAGPCVHVDYGASAYISGCEFYGGRGVYAAPTARVTMTNCKGGDFADGAAYSNGATVLCGGTIPAGTYSKGNNGILDTTGCTQNAGTNSTPPAVETVVSYDATSSGYYRTAWQSGSQMRQGYTGVRTNRMVWV